jgi:hypothetical protein
LKLFFSRLISSLIIFQFSFVFQIQNAHAGAEKVLHKSTSDSIKKQLCDGNSGKVHSATSISGESSCKAFDAVTGNDPNILREVVNMVLMMSMTLSIINNKCEVRKEIKKHLPKSRTAGITHWIHKIASVIYIFAELQNIITLRKLDSKLARKAEVAGQDNKFRVLMEIQKAKLAAAEKKQKILKISTMGLGAASAVELGMSAAYLAYGTYLKGDESVMCIGALANVTGCEAPVASSALVATSLGTQAKTVATKCTAKFGTEQLAETLTKTAKSTVIKTVAKGIGSVVGASIGKKIAEKKSDSSGAQIGGAVVGGVIGNRIAKKVVEKLIEAFADGENNPDLGNLVGETKSCITNGVKKIATDKAKDVALAAALPAACSGPQAAVLCTPAIIANCGEQLGTSKKTCVCAGRNAAQLVSTTKKIMNNLKMPDKLSKEDFKYKKYNSSLTDRENTDRGEHNSKTVDKEFKWQEDMTKSFPKDEDGITEDEKVCGIDYTDWVIRHDLECKSRFDFLSDEEKDDGEGKKKKNRGGWSSASAMLNNLEKQSNILNRLTSTKSMDIHIGLKTNNADKWARMFLNDPGLINEYNNLDTTQKSKLNKAFGMLTEAIVHLQNSIIPTAHAEKADEFVSKSNEVSVLGGLGVTAIGMLVFPKAIKKMLKMTTLLHRNSIRRGLYFLLTYFMAKENVKGNKNKIKRIKTNISQLEEIMKAEGISLEEETEESAWSIPKVLKEKFTFFPEAFGSNMIDDNLVPLCIEGDSFSTRCTCRSTNSCGNAITKVKLKSSLFKIKAFAKTASAQFSFARKMANGKATDSDLSSLERTLSAYSKDLNPIIAADNIDFTLEGHDMPRFDIVKRAKNTLASLQKSTLKDLMSQSKGKIDISKVDFNEEIIIDEEVSQRDVEPDSTVITNKASKKAKTTKSDLVKKMKSGKKAENLKDFVLDAGDVNPNTEHDLFKIINNRYKRVWLNDNLQKEQ